MKDVGKLLADMMGANRKGNDKTIIEKPNYMEIVKSLSDDEKALLTFYKYFYPDHPTYIMACESRLKEAARSLARRGLVVEVPFSAHMYLTQTGAIVSHISGY